MDNKHFSCSNIPGPDNIKQSTLANGIQILSYQNMNAETIYMIGILSNGGDCDPPQKKGLAHFTANLLSRGTRGIPFQQFHTLIESAGANLAFGCSSRHTWFRGKSLAEDLGLLIKLASDAFRAPAFKDEYVERLRRQLLASLALRDQDTGENASLLFDQSLFKDHPYAYPVDGYVESVASIIRENILDFHHTTYRPQELSIVISGAVTHQKITRLAEKYFSAWEIKEKNTAKPMETIPQAPASMIRKHRFLPGKSQVDLIAGGFGPKRNSSDFVPAYIGNNILGQFGLMGRIGKRVRSQAGLAYFASSSVSAWADTGTWDISAGVNPENTQKAIDLIRDEINRFISEDVLEEELENSKSHLIGRMPIALETNAGIANAILKMHRFNLGFDYYRKYQTMLGDVTPQEIRRVAKKYLRPDQLVITSAGPGEEQL